MDAPDRRFGPLTLTQAEYDRLVRYDRAAALLSRRSRDVDEEFIQDARRYGFGRHFPHLYLRLPDLIVSAPAKLSNCFSQGAPDVPQPIL